MVSTLFTDYWFSQMNSTFSGTGRHCRKWSYASMPSPWLLSTATIQWWHIIFSVLSLLEHKSSLEENFLLSLFAVFLNVPKEKRQKSLEFQLLLHKKNKKLTSWGTEVDTRPQLSMTERSDIRPPFSWVVWWLHFSNWGYFEDINNVASSKKACLFSFQSHRLIR